VSAVGQSRTQQKKTRVIRNLVWCGAVAVCLLSPAAQAGDWSFEGLISEKLDYLNNVKLEPSNTKDDFSASTFLKSALTYKTHDSQLDLVGDVLLPHYFDYGPISQLKYTDAHASAAYTKNFRRGSLNFGASYARQAERDDASNRFDNCDPIPGTTLVDCDGNILDTANAGTGSFQNTYKLDFGAKRLLDQRNTLTWNSTLTLVDFDHNSGSGSVAVKNQFGYTRRLTKNTTGKLAASVSWSDIHNPQDTNRLGYTFSAHVDSIRSKRTTVHAETGLSLNSTNQKDLTLPGFPDFTTDAFAAYVMAGADYRLDAVTMLTWSARYGAQEGAANNWRHTVKTEAGLTRSLNERASLAVKSSASWARNSGNGLPNEILNFTIAPALTYRLDKYWTFDTGYAFTLRDSVAGTAVSNNVYMSISKKFVVR
jgi:hypothetical protein